VAQCAYGTAGNLRSAFGRFSCLARGTKQAIELRIETNYDRGKESPNRTGPELRGAAALNCSAILRLPEALRLALILSFFLTHDSAANIHGVERVEIVPAPEPPAYDLGQIESEVTDAIKRSERNLMIQVAILSMDPLDDSGSECGDILFFPGVGIMCEAGKAIEEAVRRADIEDTVTQMQRAHVESDPTLAPDLALEVDKLLSSNYLQLRLAGAVRDFIAKQTDIDVNGGSGSSSTEHRLDTRLLNVEAVGSKVDAQIVLRLQGEVALVQLSDGAVLDRYTYTVETPGHFIEGWSQGGLVLLATSFDAGIRKMAEVLSEELLLTVYSPRQRRKGYLLKAAAPKNKVCMFGCKYNGLKNYGYYETETLQPTFEWEDFRDAYARDPLYKDTTASDLEVTYDLRIYRSRLWLMQIRSPIGESPDPLPIMLTGDLIHEFRGITGMIFTPEITLKHCTPYTWTVRARFKADGKTHLTQWSGNLKEKEIEKFRQKLISDSTGARTNRSVAGFIGIDEREYWRVESYNFPFLATTSGQKCSAEEVAAAVVQE
jgi:hypothetical protein